MPTKVLFVLAVAFLAASSRAITAAACDDSADRGALQPFLNSPDAIMAKCQNTANAPYSLVPCKGPDEKTEQLPACACTWRLLNACAEDYLDQKAKGCAATIAASSASGGQAADFRAVATRYRQAAQLESSLSAQLRDCAESAEAAGKKNSKVHAKYARDQQVIERTLATSRNPPAVLAAPRIGN